MEDGQWDAANDEKMRLEENQRAKRKRGNAPYPVWFKREPDDQNGGQNLFVYPGGYWESKERQECPNIF